MSNWFLYMDIFCRAGFYTWTLFKHIPAGSAPASLLAKAAAAFTLGIERFFDLAAFGVSR